MLVKNMGIKNLIRKNLPLVLLVGTLCGFKYLEGKIAEKIEQEYQREKIEMQIPIEYPEIPKQNLLVSPEQDQEYREMILYGNPFDSESGLRIAGTFDEYED